MVTAKRTDPVASACRAKKPTSSTPVVQDCPSRVSSAISTDPMSPAWSSSWPLTWSPSISASSDHPAAALK
jgi:hypothetical protein